MKKLLLSAISIFITIALYAQTPNASGVVFVKTVSTGTGTGNSWANATSNLQGAIDATGVSQVWVAAGTYQLAANSSYKMKNGVAIYGSFRGSGSPLMADRNFTTHTTTLKGNGASVIYNDYNGLTVTAILDGFTITGGSADSGGGIFNNSSSPSLSNLTISGNTAVFNGGGICNFYSSSPSLINVCISGNTAVFSGGGIYNISPLSSLTNVTISGNTANSGGGIYSETAITTIKNSIVFGNSTGFATSSVSPQTYTNSLVQDLTATTNGNISAGTLTANDIFTAPQAPGQSTGGDYTLKVGSPAINTDKNADNATSFDLAGNARIQKGAIDMGAYESAFSPTPVPDANGILYVKKAATGNGTSWTNALGELADALAFSNTNNAIITNAQVTQIWVANGTYKPMYTPEDGQNFSATPTDPRDKVFLLVKDVKLYGGFIGTETAISERTNLPNSSGNLGSTILSGDFNDDDGANFTNNNENAYRVVIVVRTNAVSPAIEITELNGFSITGGNTNANVNSFIKVNRQILFRTSGGAIYNHLSSPFLTNVAISGNTATNNGGGIYNFNLSSPILTNVTISCNSTTYYGGGIYNIDSSSPVLTNVTLSGNTAASGGGIYNNNNSSPVLTNVTLSGNTATGNGGGIYNTNSSPILTNVTLSGNKATASNSLGAGIYYTSNSGGSIRNSVMYNNITTANSTDRGREEIYSLNLTTTKVKVFNSIVKDYVATTANLNYTAKFVIIADPLFTNASAGDFTLQNTSPAKNAGDKILFDAGQTPDLSAITTDLAGNTRILGANIDLGAFENTFVISPDANGIIYVKQDGAGNFIGDSWANATGNLQEAIGATGVSQVWVAKGIYPLAANTYYKMKNGVAIYGSFPDSGSPLMTERNFTTNTTTLKGDGTGSVIKNDFTFGPPLTSNAILDGFTVTGGGGSNGGGIYNIKSSPILTNITVSGNTATGVGGGISNEDQSSPILTNVIISGNNAMDSGGGFYNGNSSSPILTNVTVSGNTAVRGGGIFNSWSSSILTNVILSGNQASFGGGILNTYSSPILTNVTLSGNTVTNIGGGIYNYASSPILTNVTLSGNSASTNGGAMSNDYYSSPQLRNSIVLGNNTGIVNTDNSVPVYNNSLVQGIAASGNNLDGTTILPAAVFADFTNANYTLKAGSPAINAGDKTLFNAGQTPDLSAITTDLAGNPRVIDNAIDMGAYEYQVITVLPVNLSAFTATAQNNTAKLNWSTASQQNNSAFIISRSNDGVNFKELTRVVGHGSTNVMQSYTYNDNTPLNGLNYYRLQQIDYDGKITSLGVKALNFNLTVKDIKVYPNPVVAVTTIAFESAKYNKLLVWDLNGKLLQTFEVKATDASLSIDFSRYPSGNYLIAITGAGESAVVKVIKK